MRLTVEENEYLISKFLWFLLSSQGMKERCF